MLLPRLQCPDLDSADNVAVVNFSRIANESMVTESPPTGMQC